MCNLCYITRDNLPVFDGDDDLIIGDGLELSKMTPATILILKAFDLVVYFGELSEVTHLL